MEILKDDEYLDFVANQESQFITPAVDYRQLALESFADGDSMAGIELPWPKTHEQFGIRPGEVTLWAGVNGHGKSQVLGQVAAMTIPESKWLIASLEMPIKSTINRIARQIGGLNNPTEMYLSQIMDYTANRLWIYDQIDTVPADRIIAMVHYAATKLGIENIIIDSLVKCGMAVDDYNAQKHFVDKLCWAARANNIHIHLVHHVRKSEREGRVPDKFDIKGAGEITDLVDNIIIVHRNKDKEKRVQEGEAVDKYECDNALIVAKQRHAGIEGKFALYFHDDSQQFLSSPDARPFQPAMGVVRNDSYV